jgi:hypothetical protein
VSRAEDYTVGGDPDDSRISGDFSRQPWFAPFNDGTPGNPGYRRNDDGTPLTRGSRRDYWSRSDPRSFSLRPPRPADREFDEPPIYERRLRPRRADPDYFWGNRPGY